ncbi:ABC transporter permease [Breznakiella homolactica]|uniref:ABC transporter permease n=1 Tax=Breznakiella homolactica TaxID=2798577 RepID=A0A7T8B978_9SPIR|nr:ABC transporter permease [Breznakiella homolactica]QQO07670.1 ABC transporter permease [Breznakiella homolactica]
MIKNVFTILFQRREFFLGLTLEHLGIAGLAILFSSLLGLFLGLLISEYGRLARVVTGASNIIYTIPSISLLGFLLPVTGIGNTTAVIALTVYGLLPVIGNTYTGMKNIDPDVAEAAKGMGTSRWQMLWKIKLPLALPVIISGMRTMVVMTIALGGIASFIGAGGLGVAIYRGITTNNMAMTVAGSLLIAVIAVVLDSGIHLIEKIIPWKRSIK